MRRSLGSILALWLGIAPLHLTAQDRPIADSAAREARRLAAFNTPAAPPDGWKRIKQLPGGAELVVTTTDGIIASRTLIAANDERLFLLKPASESLPRSAHRQLAMLARSHPDRLVDVAAGRIALELGNTQLTAAGVVVSGRRVSDLGDVIQVVPIENVLLIRQVSGRSGPGTAGAIGGAVAGALAGPFVGAALEPNCACDDPGLAGSIIGLFVGVPVGAIAGYLFTTQPKQEVVFRR